MASLIFLLIFEETSFSSSQLSEQDSAIIKGRTSSTATQEPHPEPFLNFLFDEMKDTLKEYIKPKNIEDLMSCLAFEADNLGLGDCVFTAFINVNLLKDLESQDKEIADKAQDLLSKIAFLTIVFNEEENIPVQKKPYSCKINSSEIKTLKNKTINEMVEYFNKKNVILTEDTKELKCEINYNDLNTNKLIYSIKGEKTEIKDPGKKLLYYLKKDKVNIHLLKRYVILGNRYEFKFNNNTDPLSSINRNGSDYKIINQNILIGKDYNKFCVFLLVNDVSYDHCFESFGSDVPNTTTQRPGEVERNENHVVVSSLQTLTKRDIYYSTKKGLTQLGDFSTIFKEKAAKIRSLYDESYQKLELLFNPSRKADFKIDSKISDAKNLTQYCLDYQITTRKEGIK